MADTKGTPLNDVVGVMPPTMTGGFPTRRENLVSMSKAPSHARRTKRGPYILAQESAGRSTALAPDSTNVETSMSLGPDAGARYPSDADVAMTVCTPPPCRYVAVRPAAPDVVPGPKSSTCVALPVDTMLLTAFIQLSGQLVQDFGLQLSNLFVLLDLFQKLFGS